MAKSKAPAILEVEKQLKQKKILPVYYFFGEDSYSIEVTLELLEKNILPFIASDFDKETLYGEKQTFANIIGLASTFPFGSEKKLIIFKQAEKTRDKKELAAYAKSPADFTVLICLHEGAVANLETEPFKTLAALGYLYEAKELKGKSLIDWLISRVDGNGKILSYENAQMLVDISGENRNALESQLEKIFIYIGENKEITIESIRGLSTSLKQYTIFDLLNAIGKKNKAASLKVVFNLLKNGMEPVQIIAMISKYFTSLARIDELVKAGTPDTSIARIVGTHPYYLKDYTAARKIYTDAQIGDAFSALFKADLTSKTTSIDNYSLLSILIAEIIP